MESKNKKPKAKILIKLGTLTWFLICLIFITLADIGINKNFNVIQWLSNAMIILGIMVFGLLMGESMSIDRQQEKVGGLYQTSLTKYEEKHQEIKNDAIYFNQFFEWFMPQELYTKKLNYLVACGVDINKAKKILDNCDLSDLFELKSHIVEKEQDDGTKIRIRKLNDYEIEPVKNVLEGNIKLNLSNANYYLTAFGDALTGSILEEGKEIENIRRHNKIRNRTVKIISTLVVSLLWGLLTVSEFASGETTQAWANLISRIGALLTSYSSGWVSGSIDVKLQSQVIINKTRVLSLFQDALLKKLFMVKSEQQLEEEEIQEYEKKKQEEIDSVVTPLGFAPVKV